MRNEGITILQLVVTIVIMIIILSVTVFYSQDVSKEANIASIYNEIKEVESVLKAAYVMNEITVSGDVISFYGEKDAEKVDNSFYSNVLSGDTLGEYYYLDFTSSRKLENVLGLENVSHDYLFDLNNLNIYLVEGIDLSLESAGLVNIKYNSDDIVNYYNNIFVK